VPGRDAAHKTSEYKMIAAHTFLSDETKPAFGLECRKAVRTGEPHRVAFFYSKTEGMMYVATEDCAGGFISHRTVAQAREDYARFVKHWGGIKSKPFCDFIAVDRYRRYVTHRVNLAA
jgi:hypothetical protein